MIYPITAYGNSILRKKALAIKEGTALKQLAQDMLDTMKNAQGIGLAAPQIGKSIRMFVVDFATTPDGALDQTQSTVLVNPVVKINEETLSTDHEEGCLSIPNVPVQVTRREDIVVHYFDTDWQPFVTCWKGFPARVILHEYDHLEGKLHIDYASPLKKRLIRGKLTDISKGKVTTDYKMSFPA